MEDTNFNLPEGIYFLVLDTDYDNDLSDETPLVLYDDGTNGDSTAGDNIYSLQGVSFADDALFTIAIVGSISVVIDSATPYYLATDDLTANITDASSYCTNYTYRWIKDGVATYPGTRMALPFNNDTSSLTYTKDYAEGNDATSFSGNIIYSETDGYFGGCYQCNGGYFGGATSPDIPQNFTVMAWFKRTGNLGGSNPSIFDIGSYGNYGFGYFFGDINICI